MTKDKFNYNDILDILGNSFLPNGEKYFSYLDKMSKNEIDKISNFQNIYSMFVNPENDATKDTIITMMFLYICNVYLKYKNVKPYISIREDEYPYYIIQPQDGKYSVLDYLINKLIQNIQVIHTSSYVGNQYTFNHGEINIRTDRYDKVENSLIKSLLYIKSLYHEVGHAMHDNYNSINLDTIIIPKCDFTILREKYNGDEELYLRKQTNIFMEKVKYFQTLSDKYNILKLNGNEKYEICTDYEPQRGFVYSSIEEANTENEAMEFARLPEMNNFFKRELGNGWCYFSYTPDNGYSLAANYVNLYNKNIAKKDIFDTEFLGYNSYFLKKLDSKYLDPDIESEKLSRNLVSLIQDGDIDYVNALRIFSQIYVEGTIDKVEDILLCPLLEEKDNIITIEDYYQDFVESQPKGRK
ncbi:MAG: hypothetical protein MR598_08975 [Erysipelotrichaceae bacterium]|nr:hypothetical protein [Erysipelotrichaceae bacterium]